MPIANFTHPMTDENYQQILKITQVATPLLYHKMPQFDMSKPLQPQIAALVEASCIEVWTGYIVNLPGYAVAAALLMQELQKRSEYFFVLQLRSIPGPVATKYEVAGIHHIRGFLGIRTE